MSIRYKILSTAITLVLGMGPTMATSEPGEKGRASVSVECTRASGLIQVNILNHRKIGKVHIEVRDAKDKLVYVEEGKAMSPELVRRLDKGMFPKGEATLRVQARDFSITQSFVIQ